MSFLTKYREYELSDDNLILWYEFADETDSGPNGNDFSFFEQNSAFFEGASVKFDDDYVNCAVTPSSFTVFLDFEKINPSAPGIILSNNDNAGNGFFLGYTENGDFFLYAVSGVETFLKFFDLKTADRAILLFSRTGNSFSLSSYSPISENFQSGVIVVPDSFAFSEETIKLGNCSTYSPSNFETSNFRLYEFALLNIGLPSFVLYDLCDEIYTTSSAPRNDFLFNFVSVRDKASASKLTNIQLNTGEDTGLVLPFSPISSGFSLLGNTPESGARFFKNGVVATPGIFSLYVTFSGQTSLDEVLFDNFGPSVVVGAHTNLVSGSSTGLFPQDKAVVSGSAGRINTDSFVTLCENNLCYNKYVVFDQNSNLIEI